MRPIRQIFTRLHGLFARSSRKSRLLAGGIVILVLLPIVVNTLLNLSDTEAAWWQESSGGSTWMKRKKVPVINNSGDSLATGTTVAITINTKELVDTEKLQNDCDDLRVLYQPDSSTETELDRYLSYPGGASCSTSEATKVYFPLQDTLADSSTDSDYYIYYSNDRAETPTSTVDAFDTTSANALLVCPFDGTTECINANGPESPTTETGAIRYSGTKTALAFDGQNTGVDGNKDRVAYTGSGLDNLTENDMTVEMWFYWTPKESNSLQSDNLISKGTGWYIYIDETYNRSVLTIDLDGVNGGCTTSTNSITQNQWTHLVAVWDRKTLETNIYLNGQEPSYHSTSNPSGSPVSDVGSALHIGQQVGSVNPAFPGLIDEVRISNVKRYTGNFTPQTTPFVRDEYTKLLYHFDENGEVPYGTSLTYDDSGNGNHGTIQGAVYAAGLVGVNTTSPADSGYVNGGNTYAGHEGIFIEESTTNKITNPSYEHATFDTSWNASDSATLTENASRPYFKFGSKSAKFDSASARYSQSQGTTWQGLYTTTSNKQLAQGFQVSTSNSPTYATLILDRNNSPTTYLRVEIQTDSSGVPSGSAISDGTSSCVAASTVSINGNAPINFSFSTSPSLTTSTQYHLVLRSFTDSGCTTEQSSADGTNYISWYYDNSGDYSYGDRATADETPTWTAGSSTDFCFAISATGSLLTNVNPDNTNTHTLSAYVYRNTFYYYAGTVDSTIAKLVFEDETVTPTYTDMGSGWWRLTYSGTPSGSTANFGVEVQYGQQIYVDGVQLEEKAYATTYADGSLTSDAGGDNTYFWDDDCDGTLDAGEDETADQNAQCSTREKTKVEYSKTDNISSTAGSISIWIKPQVPSSSLTNMQRYVIWASSSGNGYFLRYDGYTSRFNFVRNISNTPYVAEVSDTFSAREWIHLVGTWDTTSGTTLYVNNGTPNTNTTTTDPGVTDDINLGVGVGTDGGEIYQYSDLRIFDTALSSTEVADLYYSGLVSHTESYEVDRFSGSDENPVGIYHFDEGYGSTAHDSSTYANHLTISDATFDTQSGNFPAELTRTLKFDGSTSMASASAEIAREMNFGTDKFSLSGWFRHPSTVSGTDTLVSKYTSSTGYKVYMNSSGYICFDIGDGTHTDSICGTASYADSKWYHFEAVKSDTSYIVLYINGNEVARKNTLTTTGSTSNTANFAIGVANDKSNYWDGFLDEIVIYPYARSADQVKADILGSQTSALFGSQVPDPLTEGLVGYWKMDESSDGSGAVSRVDSSGNGNDLTDNNTVASTAGKYGNSSQFVSTNSEYLSVADNTTLSSGNVDYTITAWIKTSDITNGGLIINKMGSASGSEHEYFLRIHNDLSVRKFQFEWKTDNLGNSSNIHADSFGAVSNDTWYFVVAYHDSTKNEIGISVNGGAFDTTTAEGGNDGNSSFQMARPWYDSDFWDGQLDEVRVYKRVLSPAEVSQLYNWTPGPIGYWKLDEEDTSSNQDNTDALDFLLSKFDNGLIAYWKMNETSWDGTSNEVVDSSGNGNHGTASCYGGGCSIPTTATGKFGQAGNFDGSQDYLNMGDNSNLELDFPFSISAWIKINELSSSHGDGYTLLNKGTSQREILFKVCESSDNLRFSKSANGSTWTTACNAGQMTITNTDWIHVIFTVDGSGNYKYYKNGSVLEKDGAFTSSTIYHGSDPFTIGSWDVSNDMFYGSIDEVRIYDRVLSADEAEQIYQVGFSSAIIDSSGNQNIGYVYPGNGGLVTGKYNKAYSFDNEDTNIFIAHDTTIDNLPSTGMSINAWVYPKGQGENSAGVILAKNDGATPSSGWLLQMAGTYGLTFTVDGSTDLVKTTNNNVLTANAWNYVTVSWDGEMTTASSVKIYVNGSEVGYTTTTNGASRVDDTSSGLFIGNDSSSSRTFNGYIDDVKIYNYARTPAQIIQDMNAGHPAPGSPVGSALGHWSFDEGYGDTANDSGTGGNNGNLAGSGTTCPQSGDSACPSWTNDGKFGKALEYDTSGTTGDYTYIPNSTGLNITKNFTLSAWIYPIGSTNGAFISKITDVNTKQYELWETGAGKIRFEYEYSGNNYYLDTPNTVLSTNTWTHILATVDNSLNVNIYANGVLQIQDSAPHEVIQSNEPVTLGYRAGTYNSDYFDGVIDEVKIYNFALTAEQVKTEHNAGFASVWGSTGTSSTGTADSSSSREYCVPGDTSSCVGPVAEWKFDENTGSYAYDTSGNGNTGQLGTAAVGDQYEPRWTPGKYSSALNFDGGSTEDDYIDAGSDSTIDNIFDGGGTISFWFKPFGPGVSDLGRLFYKKSDGTGDNGGYNIHTEPCDATHVDLELISGTNTANSQFNAYCALTINQWQHVAVVYNDDAQANDPTYYINGVETALNQDINPTADYPSTGEASANLYIGAGPGGDDTIDGYMDEIRFYNYARTQAQIAWDYNRGGPIVWWKLDENQTGDGQTVYDSSGNGNNGTTEGGTGNLDCTVTGKRNTACDFDGGDDRVDMSSVPISSMPLSMCSWFKVDSSVGTYDILTPVSISDADASEQGAGYQLLVETRDFSSTLVEANYLFTSGTRQARANMPFDSRSNWHHACAVFSSIADRKIYVDGVLMDTESTSQSAPTNLDTTTIGAFIKNSTYEDYMNGQIDDVKIFNYALTSEQVKLEYGAGALRFGP